MADPYEVDAEGDPVAEADSAAAGEADAEIDASAEADSPADGEVSADPDAPADPAATEALRRQIEATLRFMALSTVVGLAIIAILAVVLAGARGVLILVGIVYLLTSAVAYWYLRRTLRARLAVGASPSWTSSS